MPMRLNGWMRIWVVLSVAWLALSAFATYQSVSALLGTKKWSLTHTDGRETTLVFSKAQYKDESEILKKYGPLIDKEPKKYLGHVVTEPYESYVQDHFKSELVADFSLAFIPPGGLLLLGWSVAWVRNGFVKRQPQPGAQTGGPESRGPPA